MTQYMQDMQKTGLNACLHDFRSSLRDWFAETTNAPYEVAETILGHLLGKQSRAYLSPY